MQLPLIAVLPLSTVVVLAVIVVLINVDVKRKAIRGKRGIAIQNILMHIQRTLSQSELTVLRAHKNETLETAALSGRHFFCECLWPARTLPTESEHSPAMLRTIDGYFGLHAHPDFCNDLAYFGIDPEHAEALKFHIEADPSEDAAERERHGLFYNVSVEYASGGTSPDVSGVLPEIVIAQGLHDILLARIFDKLKSLTVPQ